MHFRFIKKRNQKGQPLCGTGLFGLSSFFQDAQNTAGDDAADFPADLRHQIFGESVHRRIAGTARSFLLGLIFLLLFFQLLQLFGFFPVPCGKLFIFLQLNRLDFRQSLQLFVGGFPVDRLAVFIIQQWNG